MTGSAERQEGAVGRWAPGRFMTGGLRVKRTILILLAAGALLATTAEAQDRSRGDRCERGRSNIYRFTTPSTGTAVPYEVQVYYNQSRVRVAIGLFNLDISERTDTLGSVLGSTTGTRFTIGRAGLRPAARHELWISCSGSTDYRLLSSVQTSATVRWSRRYPFDAEQTFDAGDEARRLDVERYMEALLTP